MNLGLIGTLYSAANMLKLHRKKRVHFELHCAYKISQMWTVVNSSCQIVQVHQCINCKEMGKIEGCIMKLMLKLYPSFNDITIVPKCDTVG